MFCLPNRRTTKKWLKVVLEKLTLKINVGQSMKSLNQWFHAFHINASIDLEQQL